MYRNMMDSKLFMDVLQMHGGDEVFLWVLTAPENIPTITTHYASSGATLVPEDMLRIVCGCLRGFLFHWPQDGGILKLGGPQS